MALINIDDRDTIHQYYTGQPGKSWKVYQDRLKAENMQARVTTLGAGRFKIDLPVITCTGSNVTTWFTIPFMHSLEKMELKHVDSAGADSTDVVTYSISVNQHPNLSRTIFQIVDSIASDITDEYTNYYFEAGQYKLVFNSTNTDKLYVSITFQYTGD